MEPHYKEHLNRAIEIVGGQTALAKALGVDQPRVWNWLHRDKRLPSEFIIPIEKATGGVVTRYQLDPKVYPPEDEQQAQVERHLNH